ncbi:MAG: hypothetical protein LAO51_02325 [Acidobacteriia bacterium]|nr:hypothetical protein [Terriglobia bacterium]
MRGRAVAIALSAVLFASCSGSAPTARDRTVEEHERGYRFVLPPGWKMFGWEARSPSGSLLTIDVHSLVGADAKFVAGLPQSVVPQLEAWTLYYFNVVEQAVSRETTVGGAPALEVVYPTRIRAQDPPSRAEYWVVRNGSLLYIVRATYPAGRADTDGPAVRDLLASWTFLEATAPNAKPIATTPSPRS